MDHTPRFIEFSAQHFLMQSLVRLMINYVLELIVQTPIRCPSNSRMSAKRLARLIFCCFDITYFPTCFSLWTSHFKKESLVVGPSLAGH